jgi:hypothetical protein
LQIHGSQHRRNLASGGLLCAPKRSLVSIAVAVRRMPSRAAIGAKPVVMLALAKGLSSSISKKFWKITPMFCRLNLAQPASVCCA